MIQDVRLLWAVGAISTTIFGLLLLLVQAGYPRNLRRVLRLLGAAHICLGLSYSLRVAGPGLGRFFYEVATSTLVVVFLCLEYRAVNELKGRAPSAFWSFTPPLLIFTLCIWFSFFGRNITLQLLCSNIVNMSLGFLLALTLTRRQEAGRPFVDTLMAFFYMLLSLTLVAVIVDYFRVANFSVEYNFNTTRSLYNNGASIVLEGVIFPLYLLMVSERLSHDLLAQALRDPLTGLYNRRAFEDVAFRELSGAVRTGLGLTLVVFDIDRLKHINDTYGHHAGDAVLLVAARTLRAGLRDEDFLCRWGGDEFCALLPRADRDQAQTAIKRIHQAFVDLDFKYEGTSIEVTISTGIVTDNKQTREVSTLLKQADAALYRAKEAGRNRFAVAADR